MKLSMIAAVGQNNELGYRNRLIWHLPKDLEFFKQMTLNKKIVMGRYTFFSLPTILPDREHIIISTNNILNDNIKVYHSIEDFIKEYEQTDEEIFIIGGASIYKEFIKLCDNIYLTEIQKEAVNADTYFPEFDKDDYTKEILDNAVEKGIEYKHVLYKRRKYER